MISPEIVTQTMLGAATIILAIVTISNSRRAARTQIYENYLRGWQHINHMRISEPLIRELIGRETWPDNRAEQVALEAFVVTYLNQLSLSYRASLYGALKRSEFEGDAQDIIRVLGFMSDVGLSIIERADFHPAVKKAYLKAHKNRS